MSTKFTLAQVIAHEARVASKSKPLPPLITAVSLLKENDARRKLLTPHPATVPGKVPKFAIHANTDEQKLNKTERAWLALIRAKNYSWIGIQSITLKLGDDCRYTPDFMVLDAASGTLIAFEVKGFMRDDALVKLKVAARTYPFITFILVRKKDGQWSETVVKP